MKEPILVLHVVGRLDRGGAESRIMDLYRHIDRTKVQFYFMQHTKDHCAFEKEILSLGGKIFHVPRFQGKNYAAYTRAWQEFFRQNPGIRVVHGHMTSTAAIYLPIAKKAGVEMTIAHARSAGVDPGWKGYVTRFFRRKLYQKCDYRFTCSRLAGESVFGDQAREERKAIFIPNAIETKNFVFEEKIRAQVRHELGLTSAFIVGHVGRFSAMKNHSYMLQILEQCVQKEKEAPSLETVLLFVGDGELREKMMEQAAARGISSRVLFLGNQEEVSRYYCAMDYFLLPSLYEGLPGTAIEAQASGVKGLLSDTITREAVVTDLLEFRSIQEDPGLWAEDIMAENRKQVKAWKNAADREADMAAYVSQRQRYANIVKEASFDVEQQAERMQNFYLTGIWQVG